nr:collagen-like protein [Lactococcus lactis]
MTIVTKNSLTLSNVNDGTITHYAYAYSADGTDRFTTVYPNLNLLKGTGTPNSLTGNNTSNQASAVYYFDNNKNVQNQGLSVGDTLTCEFDWNVSNPTSGTFSLQLNNTNWRSLSQSISITSQNNSGHSKYSFVVDAGFLASVANGINRRADYLPTNSVLTISNVNFTKGSTARPWMPSASEVTNADWPSYIGQYTDFSSTASTDPAKYAPWTVFKGNDGKDGANGKDGIAGKDGIGIKTTVITYAISTSGTTAPTTGWTSSVPSLVKGQYLWTKTVWTYTDNSSETGYSVTYISKDGNNGTDGIAGKDGNGIKTTTITYVGSTSGTTVPTSGWASTIPTVAAGSYLWTKTVWTYTDNTSETGYSVAKMGNDGATGPAGPPGSNGNPGKIVSNTEPTTKFNGLTWKYSGANDITASDGTNILAGTEYYWNGTVWALYEINAHNINGDNLSVTNGTFKDGKIESVWGSNGVNGTTTIEGNHLQIHSTNSVSNTENTVALDNEQGYAQVYVDKKTGRTITVQVSSQGFFVSDSTGPYVSVTPTGIVNSVDVSWTTIGSYAAYRRDGRVVTIRVVGAKTSTAGNIYIGTIPLKDCPAASVMGDAIAWSASVTNDKHIQINGLNQQNSGSVTILSAAANQEYTFQFTYQI